MKKILFSLIALMAVMTVQAQSICGSWRTMQPVVSNQPDGTLLIQSYTFTFNEDGTYSMDDEFTLSTEPAPTMALEVATNVSLKGTYTLEGDKLIVKPNGDTYKYEILSISMNGKVTDNPMVKSQIGSILDSNDFKAGLIAETENTVKVSDSSLEMTSDGETLSLVRFSTINN
jgi:hypothetical protein